jgi:hypothetical protein
MFVPIVTLGLLGVTFTALLRLAENVAPGPRHRPTTDPGHNHCYDGCADRSAHDRQPRRPVL